MMPSFLAVFDRLFDYFTRHRIILYSATIIVILVSLIALKNINLTEDIRPMLPDGSSDAAIDFQFLQQAPFAQKVVINLRSGSGADQNALVAAADNLAGQMGQPYYTRIVTGSDLPPPSEILPWLIKVIPILSTEKDIQRIAGLLTPEQINNSLREIKKKLNSPEGWALKALLQEDPLGLYLIGLDKLRYINMFQGMVLHDNHFMSSDGRNVLIIGETPIKITDTQGASDLVRYTQDTINKHVPQNINASFISGHSYTTGNAETLKKDLSVILTCTPLIILLLLFAFLRNWQAIFVFLVPATVVCIATAGVLFTYHTISAVTIAFGSVLMGISDDYPIFTYFSLRNNRDYGGKTISRIARPVLASGITTMATFSALFFSDLPGQRQIAWFSIIGIVASLIFSLIVLPHLLKRVPPTRYVPEIPTSSKGLFYRYGIIGVWLVLMALSLWQGTSLQFNGDMRAVNMVPKSIRTTEANFRETWGDFRGKAMIFAEGNDLESALRNNDLLFNHIKREYPDEQIISFAPLLPSAETQEENLRRWELLWSYENSNKLRTLLAREGDKLGFSPHAFDAFFERLSSKPTPISIEDLKKAGFSDVINSMIVQQNATTRLLTLVPDTPEMAALFKTSGDIPFVNRFISQRRFSTIMSSSIFRNFIKYIAISSIVIILFLVLLLRNVEKVLYALIPVVTGLVFMFGAMGWSRIEFNLFNIIASILVIGLSVDLGIFMVSRISEGHDRNTSMAVLLGGLTSLVGMGALTLAQHPALYSIGMTVLLGMCGAIPSALFVIPAFYGSRDA